MNINGFPSRVFVSGTGTAVGKTYVSAILARALQADYWKPVQAGYDEITDTQWVASTTGLQTHTEAYKLKLAASPHIAAREENVTISLAEIVAAVPDIEPLVIEGAGGLMVPLNDSEFVADLIVALNVPVILVSRNMLGSINHSLLTAMVCKEKNIKVTGWIFNDEYLDYQEEIVGWTGIPSIASIPFHPDPDRRFIEEQANILQHKLSDFVW